MKAKLTAKYVDGLKSTSKWQNHFDSEIKSFALRVSPQGFKSFVLFYRVGGKLKMTTLGSTDDTPLETARALAVKTKISIKHEGVDPIAQKQAAKAEREAAKLAATAAKAEKQAETFAELAALYIQKYAQKKKRTWVEDERIIRVYLKPLAEKKMSEITRKEIKKLLTDLAEETPMMANKTLATIRKVYNWAIEVNEEDENGWSIDANPCSRMKAPGEIQIRDRVLNNEELRKVWTLAGEENPMMSRFLKLLVLTLKRIGELRKAKWTDVDFDQCIWSIPPQNSKNKTIDKVPLSAPALQILEELREQAAKDDERLEKGSFAVHISKSKGQEFAHDKNPEDD